METSYLTKKHKRGDIRDDGMVFYKYAANAKNGEYWITKEQLEKYKRNATDAQSKKYHSNPEKYNASAREMYLKNPEKYKKRSKDYAQKNKEKIKEVKRIYRENNSEKLKVTEKRCRDRKPEQYKQASRLWKQNNKEKRNARQSLYIAEKTKKDPVFKLRRNLVSLIGCCFKNNGYNKNSRTTQILGCSIEFFKNYIEQRFKNGMTWENRTAWHLDHIIPISSAKTEEETIRLNHYTNFQPLWAAENIKKGNRLTV